MHNHKCFQNHTGPWMIEAAWFSAAVAAIKAGTWKAPVSPCEKTQLSAQGLKIVYDPTSDTERPEVLYFVTPHGVAVIECDGPMMKHKSKFGGCSTITARQAIRAILQDKDAGSILLHVDSPGGNVAGTAELANEIREANTQKPVHAHIDDMGASAAYWVASQARRVTANALGMIGSIGTFAILADESKALDMAGVKLHLITTGEMKGAGADGVVTDELKSEVQGIVNSINDVFLAEIGASRGMTPKQVRDLATGQVWMAAEAKKLGLIDAVMSFDQALAALSAKTKLPADRPRTQRAVAALKIAELS